MKRLFFLLILLPIIGLFSSSYAGIEAFFKKAENKTSISSMRNIDFIYMINLDERPEKFEQSTKLLNEFGIYPYRFSAVNGWKFSNDTLEKSGVRLEPGVMRGIMGTYYAMVNGEEQIIHSPMLDESITYFSHCMSRGAVGIVYSHLSVLQDAYDSGYQTIWVLEDDIEVLSDPRELSSLVEKLGQQVGDWDVLFTDIDTKNSRGEHVPCRGMAARPNYFHPPLKFYFDKFRYISPDFSQIGMRYGAYSMIVRRNAMKKILDYFKRYKVFLPYDMDFWSIPDLKIYSCNRDIVSTLPLALSDNGGPNYLNKKN